MSKLFDVMKKSSPAIFEDFNEVEIPPEVDAPGKEQVHTIPSPAGHPALVLLPAAPHVPTRVRISTQAPILPFDPKHFIAAEQYRIIRTKILHHVRKPKLLAVSSATSGDGKTVTSINIAASFALKQEEPILLVDADLRRPRIAELLQIPSSPGLSEVLAGRASIDHALVRAEQFPNLWILPAGNDPGNPAELLDSPRWRVLVDKLRAQFSHVIFDATPVATVADYELLQHVCDGVIVVARPDHTKRTQCLEILKIIPKEKLIGIVLNCVEDWWLWKAPVYGYYRQL